MSIVANVASDLVGANSFYERSGFLTSRLKAGGATRGRKINVRILQLETPSLISLMIGPTQLTPVDFIQPKKRATNVPIYAIDLNVFFDAIQNRARSADAGSVIEAALRHQIRLAASQEFVLELERTSHSRNTDPVLSFARRIPSLPSQDKATIEKLIPSVAAIVFPERSARKQLKRNDESDVLHLAHAIAAGASGYITSDSKILNARDELMTDFNFDVIGLTEFVALLDLPRANSIVPTKQTRHCRIQTPKISDILSMLQSEGVNSNSFLGNIELSTCRRTSVGDDEGVIGVSLLTPERGIGQPSRAIVCIRQDHPYSSTIADFLISELIRWRSQSGACHILMLDIPSHPITRRIALGQGFQGQSRDSTTLAKIALGRPITNNSWDQARLAIERLSGLKLQKDCPRYDSQIVCVTSPSGETVRIDLFGLETLLSPTLFSFPKRKAVIVPITRAFASDLLGTDRQYSLLDVPEAQFLSRRTYFNATRAVRTMIPGRAIAFYESAKNRGQGAIVALARIVDVTSLPISNVPELIQRGAVVDDPGTITKSERGAMRGSW